MTRKVTPLIDRLLAKVEITDDCWVWTGAKAHGYGHIMVSKAKFAPAYRVAYELSVGPIPLGLQLDHLCRNRACVNPDHLEPVTPLENVSRGDYGAGKQRKTHCKRGHEYTPENTKPTSVGTRTCRTCANEMNAAYRLRIKDAS